MTSKDRTFDPRRSSAVVISYNEKLPGQSLLVKSAELPVKTFVVGPHKTQTRSSSRPSSAPPARPLSQHPDELAPRFLNSSGYWVPSELPEQPRPTQAQPLTASATATAEVVNSMMPKKRGAVRPVSAVHSYNDISPVITGEFVREAGGTAHMSYTMGGTAAHPGPVTSPRSILDQGGFSPRSSPANSPRGQPQARSSSNGQAPPQVYYGTNPYPGGYHANASPYKEAETVRGDVTHDNMYYYRHSGGRNGGATRPASASGGTGHYNNNNYNGNFTGNSKGVRLNGTVGANTRPLSAGPVQPGGTLRRGAATTPWQRTQHGGGDYMVNMMKTGHDDRVKVGSVHVASRTGRNDPKKTGHWTSLEPQAQTAIRPGQLGYPLEHPFSRGYSGNPTPYHGGQYTVKEGMDYPEYEGDQVYGAGGHGPHVEHDNYFTHGSTQGKGSAGNVNADGPYAAAAGNPYWKKESNVLGTADLTRVEVLGKGVVAGSANARLVGGHWKYVPRPTEGDVIYTDYYGPYGKEHANYYGRSYGVNATEFTKNRMVDDSSYHKVRASMMGIQALRDRPGLSMDNDIVHGTPEQLHALNQDNVQRKTKTMHHISQYHNLRPENPTWVAAQQ